MTNVGLFTPMTLRGVEFPNRAWVSPMCQYSAVEGVVGDWHYVHLGSFATGGAGLVMTEATAVTPVGRISVGCPGIWSDEQGAAWSAIIEFVHSMGAPMGIQLAHAGRKGSTMRPWDDHVIASDEDGGWQTIGPSPTAYSDFPVPHAMSVGEIESCVDDFEAAAIRSVAAGFDLVEIHAAHGYLLHQFYSPLTNLREDEYGGSFSGRTRLLREVCERVRGAIPESMPMFVRISATDWVDGGWDADDSVHLARDLRPLGVDLIDVSAGGLVHDAKITVGPGYQLPLATAVKEGAGIPVSAVGLITTAQQAEEIVVDGLADAVMLGRAMLRNPRWPINAAEDLGLYTPWPVQLERARLLRPRPSPQ